MLRCPFQVRYPASARHMTDILLVTGPALHSAPRNRPSSYGMIAVAHIRRLGGKCCWRRKQQRITFTLTPLHNLRMRNISVQHLVEKQIMLFLLVLCYI